MTLTTELTFVAVVFLGAYVQTLSGFALGLIVMGAVTWLGLAPIAFSAAVVALTSMFQIGLQLQREHHHVAWRNALYAGLGAAPALFLGLWLLDTLSLDAQLWLRRLLGGFILVGGLLLMLRPHPRPRPSGAHRDLLMGGLGGLFGGLFSTAGPPMVYHLYREPLPLDTIRTTLLAVFGCITVIRNGYLGITGELDMEMLRLSLLCVPAVYLATRLGQRYRPPISENGMRRFAFALLTLLGVGLLLA